MNLQVIVSSGGGLLWVSGTLAKEFAAMRSFIDELEKAGLVTLADKGCPGSAHAKVPCKGKGKPESQKTSNRAHARLRGPGERANAQLKNLAYPPEAPLLPWQAGNSPRRSTP
jgi:DDE superfamily endonuclease